MRVFPIAALVVFTVFVAVFAGSANKSDVRGLPRWVWVLLILVATPIGGLLYLFFGRPLPGAAGSGASGTSTGSARRTATVAPDDDAAFLRRLEDDMRRDRENRRKRGDLDGDANDD